MSKILKNVLLITLLACASIPIQAQTSPPVILDIQKRAEVQNAWLTHRLDTDTQQHAYLLKPRESDTPKGLKDALKTGNRLQDILTNNFKTGRSGNKILKA